MLSRSDWDKCIGEWVEIHSDEEIDEAKLYLELWKKFYLRQLPGYEFVDEEYISKKKIFDGKRYFDSIGLKVYLKKVENDESDA